MAALRLQEWVDEATRGLCDEARVRVRREILGHYEDAVVDELERGRTEDEARAAAMESLGSAKAAGREYRRTYLTAKEAKRARLDDSDVDPSVVQDGIRGAALMGFLACCFASTSIATFACLFLIMSGYFAFFRWEWKTNRAATLRRQGHRKLALLLKMAVYSYYYYVVAALCAYGALHKTGSEWYFGLVSSLITCVMCIYSTFRSIAFELKLRRLNYPDNPTGSA